MEMQFKIYLFFLFVLLLSCKKEKNHEEPDVKPPASFNFSELKVDGLYSGFNYYDVKLNPKIKLAFSTSVKQSSLKNAVSFFDADGNTENYTAVYEDQDKTVIIQPEKPLDPLTAYKLSVTANLEGVSGAKLPGGFVINLTTTLDSTDKFPRISDEELLTLVQRQTFKYFWDFGHPVSGLARERNTSGDLVTTGGSGFGIMAIVTAVHRGFISRTEGLARIQLITDFLKNKAERFHGAYPHWLNGNTGKTIAFSQKDNGADLVETSFLMQGLLTARQYFNGNDAAETALRNDINEIWLGVEWDWFRKGGENVLYWHWSPNYGWDMNLPIRGWDEALVTYVLAASSPTHTIPKAVYDEGWARNGAMKNGNSYYGIQLPLGPQFGGPLFFSHYSFLGINSKGLTDAYANYETQNRAHTLVNYNYCKANPKGFSGYSEDCWGLTASDDINGYMAHSPTNDNGVISPTAALSSFPYTPEESMRALKFFYYKLGDKLWKEYGFVDAFSLHDVWFADSFLAIDQGPIIVMIENQRSGLLWDLFMSCPEIKAGMRKLGFQGPGL